MKINQDNCKLLYHPENIREWLSLGMCQPVTVEIDPSLMCNHKCPQCTFRDYLKRKFIPWHVLKRLVIELSIVGVKGVIISGGGEPLTNPDTPRFIELLAQAGVKVTLSTNGFTLDKNMESLLANCSRIRVSVDAASPQVYLKTHGVPDSYFNRMLDNLRAAVRTKRNLGFRTNLGISFLVSSQTRKDIVPAMALFKEIGVDLIQFKPMQIYDESKNQWYYENIGPLEEYIANKYNFESETFKISFLREKYFAGQEYKRGYTRCHGAHFDLAIGADSKIYLCSHLKYNPSYCLGDLQSESLADIIERIEANSQVTKDCIPFCRLDAINELLEDFSKNPDSAISTLNEFKGDDALDKNWL